SVGVRVVNDRRKEVDGLHERRTALPQVHTGIVLSPEVDEDSRIVLGRQVAQDLSELARGEFARSTSATDHFGQSALRCKQGHGRIVV
ncbi:MAG: hypothetical protein ACRD1H_05785, partial [Vicinamibacterales bacterium]